ncbi:ParB/RepB/Spo0J family partition protein [Mechercharimyces sp. CAU 1602]|uniref:ParB/RepB/Spo0J family partition protein n=1 Tax=Mechercharimyces sp. CAU 1602 TaxID=2973933 RepID=UPI0021621997|nr:ParB/RepB/Spo0J family partition protein [Mechercharimyces sp. CAU 1602]MCS1352686.1 ParB/RepB/Spo0J family partition protein [Mechercharimyces sp. CAU 1602]
MGNKRLGKGLGALLPAVEADASDELQEVVVAELRPNPYQPRKTFDPDLMNELVDSIREHGIVQPLVVRKSIRGYEIVAGERRFRAAKQLKWERVPVVIREFTDEQMMEIALIENVQRDDLNPMELAQAYYKLMKQFAMKQEDLAKKVGKSRPHVANVLRLLQLPSVLQEYVSRGTLSMGHARALLGVKDDALQAMLGEKVIQEGASVRQLEQWIQQLQDSSKTKKKKIPPKTDPAVKHYEEMLQEIFSTPVHIKNGKRKGKIEIEFFSSRELERLIEILQQERMID